VEGQVQEAAYFVGYLGGYLPGTAGLAPYTYDILDEKGLAGPKASNSYKH
jgi:hypothetical protein